MKRIHDWYKLQKQYQGWKEIEPDQDVVQRVSNQSWSLDLDHCHGSLKKLLAGVNSHKTHTDFFVLTDIELSKLPLNIIFKIIQHKYNQSRVGGYIALLSYYINSTTQYNGLNGTYSENIHSVFERELSFVRKLENQSSVVDFPINIVDRGTLVEGSNFIFVHPNIRYYLWK